jgi:hypothetical protein
VKTSAAEQRLELRRRLQQQRAAYSQQFSAAVYAGSLQPRSLTMSLLRRHSTLKVWILREFLPLVVLHFLGQSGPRLLHALLTANGPPPTHVD